MARGGRLLIWAVLVAITSSGCGFAIAETWPTRSYRRVVTVSEPVTVRGNLPGAVVETADGKTILGPAPLDIAAEFEVAKTWTERSIAASIIGGVVALGLMAYSGYKVVDQASHQELWAIAMGVELLDMVYTGGRVPGRKARNDAARYAAETNAIPRDHTYRLRWPGFDPVTVSATMPGARELIGRRPTEVSFAQAVLYWQQRTDTEPAGEALFELGAAHLEVAEPIGDRAGAHTAEEYLERYLADPSASRTDEARALLERARQVAK